MTLKLRTLSTTTWRRTAWTRDMILRRILERERAGLSLESIPVRREAFNLLHAARRHFGSWDRAVSNARRAAFDPVVVHTRETIIARLREHAAMGLRVVSTHPRLKDCRHSAQRLFGGWAAAVEAAGIPPASRRAHSRFTRESLVALLRERRLAGLSLAGGCPELKPWRPCAYRHFGSWILAREAAGDTAQPAIRRCTREQLLALLRERARAGQPLEAKHPDLRPYQGIARRLFGSWTRAREEAGCARPLPFTADEVLTAITGALDAGRSPRIHEPALQPYEGAARKFFGGWRQAVQRARELRRNDPASRSPVVQPKQPPTISPSE